jgi:type IV pilus assembly protein PilB
MGVKDSLLGRLLGSAGAFSQSQVAQTIDLLLEHGQARGASDIHIEPHGQLVWVRYRIHGSLHGLHKLPIAALEPLANTLKTEANLPLDTGMPQESSFSRTVKDQPLDLRLNVMPVIGGERLVLHFSQPRPRPVNLEALGFWGSNAELVRATLARIHGIILVASTKQVHASATLYGLLHLLRTAPISIATIEETIERHVAGMNQTQVKNHSAAAYADGLRAALRQDINAIMLADLPGKNVAGEAVRASTTGHMVLAGVRADTAAKALIHLKHMGVEPFMLATSLRASIAVRPIRRLCPGCRERIVPAASIRARLEKIFGMTTPATRKRIHSLETQAKAAGIGADLPLNSTPSHLTHVWRAHEHGCEDCHFTGYQGSINLTEVLPGGEYLYTSLAADTTALKLQTAALKEGFIPLALDGIIKALRGETTITEVIYEVSQS